MLILGQFAVPSRRRAGPNYVRVLGYIRRPSILGNRGNQTSMSFLSATGAYLPATVLRNEGIAPRVGVSPEWIFNVSGIRERRIANDHETIVSMAVEAGRQCLHQAHLRQLHGNVGAVLVSTGSHQRRFPGPAATIAAELGLRGRLALDVPVASAGAIFALALGSSLTATYGNVLVICTEKMSSFVLKDPVERGSAPLFGDGAGACLLRNDHGFARVEASALHSDGKFSQDLTLSCDGQFAMNGRSVIKHATQKIPEVIREVLTRTSTEISDVVSFILHQANLCVIQRAAEKLGVPLTRFFCNIERYGNTSSASMLIALHEWCQQYTLPKNKPMVLAGFGAGYHWGAALVRGC